MEIEVKDLKSNPFRRMENYPVDREKIENLKNSIKETSFWENSFCKRKRRLDGLVD
jgi:hypothetical protein